LRRWGKGMGEVRCLGEGGGGGMGEMKRGRDETMDELKMRMS
jgi:hypothetical protein